MTDNTEPTIDELVEMCFDDLCINNTGNYIRITFGDKSMNVDYEHFLAFRKRIEALISDQVAKAKGCTTCGKRMCDNCERLWQT